MLRLIYKVFAPDCLLMFFAFFPSHFRTRGLNVNTILDLLDEDEVLDVEGIYLDPPEGDESDGYDVSDTEEGEPTAISRNLLQVCLLSKLEMYSTMDVKSNNQPKYSVFVQFLIFQFTMDVQLAR